MHDILLSALSSRRLCSNMENLKTVSSDASDNEFDPFEWYKFSSTFFFQLELFLLQYLQIIIFPRNDYQYSYQSANIRMNYLLSLYSK